MASGGALHGRRSSTSRPWPPHRDPLDIAGGGSSDSLHFARLGLDVTVADVSDVGLIQATQLPRRRPQDSTIEIDLETESIPAGRWDVITVANYLQRDLFESLVDHLAEDGVIGG